jgi:hypothetical protein
MLQCRSRFVTVGSSGLLDADQQDPGARRQSAGPDRHRACNKRQQNRNISATLILFMGAKNLRAMTVDDIGAALFSAADPRLLDQTTNSILVRKKT